MRLLADESLEGRIVAGLRERGHDVVYVAESHARLADPAVLQPANQQHRILLTNDKDFAELAFLRHLASTGIVLFRMHLGTAEDKLARLLQLVALSTAHLDGAFTVIHADPHRRRALPSRKGS